MLGLVSARRRLALRQSLVAVASSLAILTGLGCSGSSPDAAQPGSGTDSGAPGVNDGGAPPPEASGGDGGAANDGGAAGSAGALVALNALVPELGQAPAGGCSGGAGAGTQYCDFFEYVAPHVNGVSTFLVWSQIDHGASGPCVEGSTANPCDWTAYDAYVEAFVKAGLTVNLVVIGVPEGGMSNQGTPDYVFTSAYAASLGAPSQDMVVCNLWPGNKASPVHGSKSVSGVWNEGACYATAGGCAGSAPYADHNGFPVVYEKPYATAYQSFIANVVKHYSPAGAGMGPALASHIGYARFGVTAGGEAQMFCDTVWPGPSGLAAAPLAYSSDAFLGSSSAPESGYVSSLIGTIAGAKPVMKTLINAHAGPPSNSDLGFADSMVEIATASGVGFGMEALSIGDAYEDSLGKPCNDDWCKNFGAHAGTGVPLVLQSTIPTMQPTYAASIDGNGTEATATCGPSCDFYVGNSGWVTVSGSDPAGFDGTFLITGGEPNTAITFASKTSGKSSSATLEGPDYLPTTIPFAVKNHATALEIYLCDLFYAFDPNAVSGQNCSTPPGPQSNAYAAVLGTVGTGLGRGAK
jgi:hypothetical protein